LYCISDRTKALRLGSAFKFEKAYSLVSPELQNETDDPDGDEYPYRYGKTESGEKALVILTSQGGFLILLDYGHVYYP
jgi:hypothetical protein